MTYDEIYRLIKYDDRDEKLFMPNEIFEDLKKNVTKTVHIPFAYTYIYFVTWLYRYTKNITTGNVIDNSKIKEVLGYNSKNQTLNYLIKKDGLLDKIEYLKSIRDFPVGWSFSTYKNEELEFQLFSEMKDYTEHLPSVSSRFFIKYPIKGFTRIKTEMNKEQELIEYEEIGTFYDVSNTHDISFEVFMYCMSNSDIGCTGFYLYSYLKHKNDLFISGYDISLEKLSKETGITSRTVARYIGLLKSYNLINFRHNQDYYIENLPFEERRPNTYITNSCFLFSDSKIPYNRINYMSEENYLKLKQDKDSDSTIEIDLPFDF